MYETFFKIVEHGSFEYFESVRLREEILRKSLGLTFLKEELEKEKEHIHIVGFDSENIISSAVLVPEGQVCKMQRVVVKESRQNDGVGSKMMEFCEATAKKYGFSEIYCHARDQAVNFYLKNGYVPAGDYFVEDTIAHLKMKKSLLY